MQGREDPRNSMVSFAVTLVTVTGRAPMFTLNRGGAMNTTHRIARSAISHALLTKWKSWYVPSAMRPTVAARNGTTTLLSTIWQSCVRNVAPVQNARRKTDKKATTKEPQTAKTSS